MSSAAEIETYIGPLTKELREASQQLLNAEKAVKAVSDSCIQYADEITQIPLVQKRFEELRGQIVDKDATISNQKIALDVLEQRASDKEQAAKSEVAANRAEKERLQSEKEDILRQREADNEKLRAREEKRALAIEGCTGQRIHRSKEDSRERLGEEREGASGKSSKAGSHQHKGS
jgi:chromosome segregation ATPase